MTREEAIAYFVARRNYNPHDGNTEAERIAIAALRFQQEQESKPLNGWISVQDRLPEPWKQVLIYSRHDFCESAFYIGVPGKWRVTWNHEMLDADSVTHWMPMPNPPKGE